MPSSVRIPVAVPRQDGRRRAEYECSITIASRVDLFLHLGLLWDMWPIRDHGHDTVGPDADEDVRLITNVSAHGLHPPERGSSVPRAGNSSPSRPRRPRAALRERVPDIARSSASRCLGSAADAPLAVEPGRSIVVGSHPLWTLHGAHRVAAP